MKSFSLSSSPSVADRSAVPPADLCVWELRPGEHDHCLPIGSTGRTGGSRHLPLLHWLVQGCILDFSKSEHALSVLSVSCFGCDPKPLQFWIVKCVKSYSLVGFSWRKLVLVLGCFRCLLAEAAATMPTARSLWCFCSSSSPTWCPLNLHSTSRCIFPVHLNNTHFTPLNIHIKYFNHLLIGHFKMYRPTSVKRINVTLLIPSQRVVLEGSETYIVWGCQRESWEHRPDDFLGFITRLCHFHWTDSYSPPTVCTRQTPQPADGVRLPGQDQTGWPQGERRLRPKLFNTLFDSH